MTHFKKLWLIGVSAAFAALLAGTAHADTSRQEFNAARQKWQVAEIHDYSFTFFQSCFCLNRQAVRVVVKDDKVHSANNVRGDTAVTAEQVGKPLTMTEIFQQIEEGYAKPADRIRLSLNPQYGYPEEVYIDYVEMMADEELRYSISDFTH
jgi:hypothetical protein